MHLQPTDCARAREFVSAQLDGELPALDAERLETHLLLCPDCAAWADDVQETTRLLREAALEAPAERFALPRLRIRWQVGSAVAVASAAAVVATMFLGAGQHGFMGSQHAAPTTSLPAATANRISVKTDFGVAGFLDALPTSSVTSTRYFPAI